MEMTYALTQTNETALSSGMKDEAYGLQTVAEHEIIHAERKKTGSIHLPLKGN